MSKDVSSGNVIIAMGTDHPALFSEVFDAGPASWVRGKAPSMPGNYQFRVRHQQELPPGLVSSPDEGGHSFRVKAERPVRAIAPGQVVALYDGDECLGSAPILRAGTYHDRTEKLQDDSAQTIK